MKSILVQKTKFFPNSITSSYRLLAIEDIKVNLVLEEIELKNTETKELTLTDRHWQDILKVNPGINFELL